MTDDRRQWAIARIRAKRALWVHLLVYVAVNALLVGIWAVTSAESFWPIWPILGWGIGLAAHVTTVVVGPVQISEERIDQELQKRDRAGNATEART